MFIRVCVTGIFPFFLIFQVTDNVIVLQFITKTIQHICLRKLKDPLR